MTIKISISIIIIKISLTILVSRPTVGVLFIVSCLIFPVLPRDRSGFINRVRTGGMTCKMVSQHAGLV